MRSPTAAQVLDLWDGWDSAPLPDRALALLQVVAPEVDGRVLTVGERDRGLIRLRSMLLGPTMEMVVSCPKCASDLSFAVEAEELLQSIRNGQAGDSLAAVEQGDWRVACRLPTAGDLCDAARCGDVAAARSLLLDRCVTEAWDDKTPVTADVLPQDVQAAVSAALEAASSSSEINFEVACLDCRHEWSAEFDITTYLWAELDLLAARILWDVHALADAYGWQESEILAMSAKRRSAYIDLLA
jgi:hypothetical protein